MGLQQGAYLAAVATATALAVAGWFHVRRLTELLSDAVKRRNRLAVELMSSRNQRMHSEESVRHGRQFRPRPTDVFVVTYPKCGTTWMTQIVHALRANASMDFGDINEVCPWDILAFDCKQDLDVDQGYVDPATKRWTAVHPRCFKSHEGWADVAKGGKYIYVARNPADAFFSFFKVRSARGGCTDTGEYQHAYTNAHTRTRTHTCTRTHARTR
jgi:hypothetical protein